MLSPLLSRTAFGSLVVYLAAALDIQDCCSTAQDATAFAIIYGTPLAAYANATLPLLLSSQTNNISSAPALLDASFQSVVRPNVDTLYSLAAIDISHDDLVISIPAIDDGRYWSFAFLDPFGDDVADISIITASPAGDYLIRRAADAGVAPGLRILDPHDEECSGKYVGIVNFPTDYGLLNGRILVLRNDTQDLSIIHSYQAKLKLVSTPRTAENPNLPQAPFLTPTLLDTSNISVPLLKTLTLTARLGLYVQPIVAADRYRVGTILGQAGVTPSGYAPVSGVNLTLAAVTAAAISQQALLSGLSSQANGWVLQNLTTQAKFGDSYSVRAAIAVAGYLQLPSKQALYPIWGPGTLAGESLGADQAYLFTFFGAPPVDACKGGFWSLTVYGAGQFLVPNSLGRYEIGDRTPGLHYPDGGHVYSAASAEQSVNRSTCTTKIAPSDFATRMFQVLLQPDNLVPPQNWTSNWLPAPSGGGILSFNLRWYAPTAGLSHGKYIYPLVQKIAAIIA
ncbi:hypothetical protein ANO11243_018350 [Dothideomycetidae sp. 11243]|nr:hypothetical protein ANO11243_018350 [fungal sp. No.11243]